MFPFLFVKSIEVNVFSFDNVPLETHNEPQQPHSVSFLRRKIRDIQILKPECRNHNFAFTVLLFAPLFSYMLQVSIGILKTTCVFFNFIKAITFFYFLF